MKGSNLMNIAGYAETLRKHRRALHQIPELDRALYKTKEYIMQVIGGYDCEITEHCETGLCAFFDKGADSTLAFRTDMDALPITECNEVSYKSQHTGKMHACGHDGHMAMLLGLAEYVNAHDLNYNILLMFQPAEESGGAGGGKELCASGILERHNTKAVFGIHLWPFLAAGKIGSRPGVLMARFTKMLVQVKGKSAHATAPEKGINALHAACRFVDKAYAKHDLLLETAKQAEEKTIFCTGVLNSGAAFNIIPDTARIDGTIRAFQDERFEQVQALVQESADETKAQIGADFSIEYTEGYPILSNDPALYKSLDYLDITELEEPLLISEDFAFYGLRVPMVMFMLGTGNDIALHSARFDFDESILVKGLETYLSIIEHF